MVDFIKIRSKNLVNTANLWLALSGSIMLINIYLYSLKPCSAFDSWRKSLLFKKIKQPSQSAYAILQYMHTSSNRATV